MLLQGCTRVELGIQTTFDDVLKHVHRGHTVQDSIDTIAVLRDLGFKLNFHVMLGLPLMTRERDLSAAHRIFGDEAFKPDMVKLYPCLVMPGTPLYADWKAGRYTPLTTAESTSLIAEILSFVPRWCRVMRVQRDIPTHVTAAGPDRTNLRQYVDEHMRARGIVSADIRAREAKKIIGKPTIHCTQYRASGGDEYFISLDDAQGGLLGFCRLRFPPRSLREEITPATAIVRELHVYGKQMSIGVEGGCSDVQHRGLGKRLLAEAERVARRAGKKKVLVISGVGVRGYYAKLGYVREGPYMAKSLK
ncbi:tRNA uridine(34) 5-carboxymethylaminomethyl modification radical SAM/GNAT enzyme Elp3 [Candidatus Woesearchaeota archaeon]|nr:MAG: tRNA uridine(34) 5-carboxymethylaminomethyl modification radical SAM/GNAT enzyme Elp3 [Candidatus Woesearchaeota archaeon]